MSPSHAARPARRPRPARGLRAVLVMALVLLLAQVGLYAVVARAMHQAVTRAVPDGTVDLRPCRRPLGWDLAHQRIDCSVLTGEHVAVPVAGRHVEVARLDATVRGLERAGGGAWRARAVEGSAWVTWSELSHLTGAAFSRGPDGVLQVTGTMTVLHESMAVQLEGWPLLDVEAQQLRIDDPTAVIGGVPVPPELLSGVLEQVSARYPLPSAAGMRWTSAEVTGDGVELGFASDALVVTNS